MVSVAVVDEPPDELVEVEDCPCNSIRSLVTLVGKDGMAGAAVAEASDGLVDEVAPDAAWAGAVMLWVEVVVVVTVPVGAAGVADAVAAGVVAAPVGAAAGVAGAATAAGALGSFAATPG